VISIAQRIHNALPQTQCTRCGYPDCQAYAEAIAESQVPINQCPPGGQEGIALLASITGQAITPLNPEHGVEMPMTVAVIDEAWCIGCTLCLKVCPTDAILGSNKMMHTVIESACTGCDLCLPVCPVDCIEMRPISEDRTGWAAWSPEQAQQARTRYEARQHRLRVEEKLETDQATARKQDVIQAALLKAKARKLT
jgi:electron transport complex protein RnfB